jgi:hypothetical protein
MLSDDAPVDAGQADTQTPQTPESKPWYDGADDDTVGFVQNKKWDSPLKVIDAYRNLEKFHGVPADQILKMPKGDDIDGWNAVYNRLGRPEAPDKYGNDGLKLPEGIEPDAQLMSKFDDIVHRAGLTKSQRDAVYSEYFTIETQRAEEITQKIEQEKQIQLESLKKEWGDKFGERAELAKRAFRAVLPEGADKEVVAQAFEDTLGPALAAKIFANIADKFTEDKFHDGDAGPDRFGYTREQAINDKSTLFSEIKTDPQRLATYNKGMGPDYEKVERLQKIIAQA